VARSGSQQPARASGLWGKAAPPWGRAGAALVLGAAVALVLSLYLSDFYVRRARDEAGHSPAAQLADARAAANLDPWSSDPHYLEAAALESMGERAQAERQLEDSRRLEPTSSVPFGLLGDFEARGHDFAKARGYYRQALALDPLDVGLQQLALSGGRPPSS
jgi:tetratricopeptide (TPR) repeat protein